MILKHFLFSPKEMEEKPRTIPLTCAYVFVRGIQAGQRCTGFVYGERFCLEHSIIETSRSFQQPPQPPQPPPFSPDPGSGDHRFDSSRIFYGPSGDDVRRTVSNTPHVDMIRWLYSRSISVQPPVPPQDIGIPIIPSTIPSTMLPIVPPTRRSLERDFVNPVNPVNLPPQWEIFNAGKDLEHIMRCVKNGNIYKYCGEKEIRAISVARDVRLLEGEEIKMLLCLDEINPIWLLEIYRMPLEELADNIIKIKIWTVLHGDPCNGMFPYCHPKLIGGDSYRGTDLVDFIFLLLVFKQGNITGSIMNLSAIKRVRLGDTLIVLGVPYKELDFLSGDFMREMLRDHDLAKRPPNFSEMMRRYFTIEGSSRSVLLARINGIDPPSTRKITDGPPHILEETIINLDKVDLKELADKIGMVHPTGQSPTLAYMESQIEHYAHLFNRIHVSYPITEGILHHQDTRIAYFSNLTDTEMMGFCKIRPNFTDRIDLIKVLAKCYSEPTFFISLDPSRSINKETISLTEVTDKSVPLIAYGTWFAHFTYEISEFIAAFSPTSGTPHFMRPDNAKEYFEGSKISDLENLVQILWPNLYPDLQRVILDVRIKGVDLSREDKNVLVGFSLLLNKDVLKRCLDQLFFCGMYMRRWKGPGHSFPIRESQTLTEHEDEFDLQKRVSAELEKLRELTKECQFFNTLMCKELRRGNILSISDSLGLILSKVRSNKYCIRQASTIFVGTAWHYSRLLFSNSFDFDITIDTIA